MRRLVMVGALLAFAMALGCSSGGTVVLGNPLPKDTPVEKVNPGKLHLSFMRYLDNYVEMEAQYAQTLNTSPLEGYRALTVKHSYGMSYVLVKEGLYENELAMLKKGTTIKAYGRVAAHRLPTDESPRISIVINE